MLTDSNILCTLCGFSLTRHHLKNKSKACQTSGKILNGNLQFHLRWINTHHNRLDYDKRDNSDTVNWEMEPVQEHCHDICTVPPLTCTTAKQNNPMIKCKQELRDTLCTQHRSNIKETKKLHKNQYTLSTYKSSIKLHLTKKNLKCRLSCYLCTEGELRNQTEKNNPEKFLILAR